MLASVLAEERLNLDDGMRLVECGSLPPSYRPRRQTRFSHHFVESRRRKLQDFGRGAENLLPKMSHQTSPVGNVAAAYTFPAVCWVSSLSGSARATFDNPSFSISS